MNVIYKPSEHDAAKLHVTGAARYVDDLPTVKGTLHLAFGLSDAARAKILSLDVDPVRRSPGVVDVILTGDLPGANDVSPSIKDEPLLAEGEVYYAGQPLFIVVAGSHHEARKAARRAKIEYEEFDPLVDYESAIEAESRFEEARVYQTGDAEAAVGAAAHRVEGEVEIGGQEHFYLEGQAALAIPQENGDMHVCVSSQHPTEVQHKVADSLGVPMNAVRVEVRRMGGGFGGKESQSNALAVACAVAARSTGSPCKMRYDRDDDMTITGKRHDFRIRYRAGFDADGKIQGVVFDQYTRCGWALDLSLAVADRAMLHADNAYYLPNAKINSHRLRTHMQSATAFRGFGGPQGMIGIETVMDHAARVLEMDPLEVRRRNYYAPAGSANLQKTPYRMTVEDCVIGEITDELVESSNYLERREEVRKWNAENPIIKRGIALTPVKFGISFTLTHLNQAGALVHVYQDGSIHLNHGGTEMGQGLFVKVAQVAADAFGQPLDTVKITATDTGKVPNTSATAASAGSDLNGMAVKCACDEITGRIKSMLAEMHQSSSDQVRFEGGKIVVGDESYEFKEAVHLAYVNRVSLSATGFYATPKINWDRLMGRGRPFFYFAYGAAVTEVAIDTLTGENRILRADLLNDAGKSINPAIDLGQVEGGYVQGAGWLTTEELVWDDAGRLKTHAPSTYKIPACSDRPAVFNSALWSGGCNSESTICKSKAVGEPPLMLAISVLMAISDAVAACGNESSAYLPMDAPATPERVLKAVEKVRGREFDAA